MAVTNNERVGTTLDLLKTGLHPFGECELRGVYKERWGEQAIACLRDPRNAGSAEAPRFDIAALLTIIWEQWRPAFARVFGQYERTLVSELREMRNRWAHQTPFSTDDTYRALDSITRLLTAVSAPEAAEVEREKQELLRRRFDEQVRYENRKAAVAPVEGRPQAGLRPWREIVTPHRDVASGRYQQAEFAADLGQVHNGQGSSEYRDPAEFYRRTFLTDGLTHLLTNALVRLSGSGGDPVVELQTNFGGGKTHSMLALYHLFSGTPATDLAGVEPVLKQAGVSQPPTARRAVLVGTALSPGQPHRAADGTEIHTLWGELAWQLGSKDGYDLLAEADRSGVSPGSDVLRDLFGFFSPCLILIDEWVAFVRQLYGVDGLPAGSFDANLSFAQALTDAARQTTGTLVVASIPASDIEVGGEAGKAALERIKNTFGRMESAWRPASADEGCEIVRRRLFEPITDAKDFVSRDAVARAFAELYRGQTGEFPANCREADYERRIKAAYPIHPELFDRLYTDWSTLDKFQRTRGVLRLMAGVIHTLWQRQDGGVLIMPASVPVDEPSVQFELTRYMDDPWVPVIETDVDGPTALPVRLDQENTTFGRYSACRRVARTLYLGSAPTLHTSQRGLDDRSLKLGCVQPGETVATFGDALRRLTDQATHLYQDGTRYWFSTQPSVTRLAQDRAEQQSADIVLEELRRRLRDEAKTRGDFARVHPCPPSSAEVPDEAEARLVILDPEMAHSLKTAESSARLAAAALLDQRGGGPRRFRNMVVFLAADRARLAELQRGVQQYLAWKSIWDERGILNLDPFQQTQVEQRFKQADETVRHRIPETYIWLLAPEQTPNGLVEWQELRVQGDEPLAVRASRKLRNEDLLITAYAPTLLRGQLDRIPLWRGHHVGIRQLWEDFAQYSYLPRLKDSDVLLTSIRSGIGMLPWQQETFAYAQSWDEIKQRYLGLLAGQAGSVTLDSSSLLVKPDIAVRQLDAEQAERRERERQTTDAGTGTTERDGGTTTATETATTIGTKIREHDSHQTVPHRFFGTVRLEPLRVGRDAGVVAQEVIQHLSGLVGAEVEVTLEIQVRVPEGVPEHAVRVVTENCRVLRFASAEFEER
ncbi:MAG: Swt1 family HEPN domain-containing protein [Solirubrobacteraceae bacterium]